MMKSLATALLLCVVGCTSPRDQVAIVLGKRICAADLKPDARMFALKQADLSSADFAAWQKNYSGERLSQLIREPIMRRYMREHNLAVSDRDLIAHLKKGVKPIPEGILDKEGKAFFRSIIESRLFAKSLFEEYGGRVAISSFGFADAVDARSAFLRQQTQAGVFVIDDPTLREAFWKNTTNQWLDATLTEEEAREMFSRPGFPMDKE